jgi:hypothetical protein
MKKRCLLIIVFMVGKAISLLAGSIYAGTEVQDIIELNNNAYPKHKYGIVIFSHRKHQEEYRTKYPEFYRPGCGECHHDEDNKPLANLKEGDDVKNCIECHKKPEYIQGKKAKRLSKKQRREYHANAIHDNCKGCHRKYNKKFKKTSKTGAPYTCFSCHPKKKK